MHVIVSAGGDAPDSNWVGSVDAADFTIAADSGLAHLLAAGRHADLIVGDLDSVDPAQLADAVSRGTKVDQHPTDKDMTDLELALHAALDAGATRVTVLGAGGGRIDHFAANLALLAAPAWVNVDVVAMIGSACVTVVRSRANLTGTVGSILTLLPPGAPAIGITTAGLRWNLTNETLEPGSTRGVSNELIAPSVTVTVTSGVLLAIQPTGGQ